MQNIPCGMPDFSDICNSSKTKRWLRLGFAPRIYGFELTLILRVCRKTLNLNPYSMLKTSRQSGKQASKQAGRQASRPASKQPSERAGKQASVTVGHPSHLATCNVLAPGHPSSKQASTQAGKQEGKQASITGSQASKQASETGDHVKRRKEASKQAAS